MHKRLTITIDEKVYEGLYQVIGRGNISGFIEKVITPYVTGENLEAAYRNMSKDTEKEEEALEWSERSLNNNEAW